MPALTSGDLAPDFTLTTIDGHAMNLERLLTRGPVILAFFKVSCPVCQYAFPMYERLIKAHPRAGATFLGICQNGVPEAKTFASEYGITFPLALDNEATDYVLSNAFGITNVPTLFYIDPNGEIEVSSVGWSKADVEEVNAMLADLGGQKAPRLWRAGEDVPAFRAG